MYHEDLSGPYNADMSLDISYMGGLWDALALFRRSRSRARKICVDARVCRVCIQFSKRGESCTGDQGSSELVSPLKAFLRRRPKSTLLLLCSEWFQGGQRHAAVTRQKCESLILNNRSTMRRMRFYGIAVGASSNAVVLDKSSARRSSYADMCSARLCSKCKFTLYVFLCNLKNHFSLGGVYEHLAVSFIHTEKSY